MNAITASNRVLMEAATYWDYRPHMIGLIQLDMMAFLEEAERMSKGKAVAESGDLSEPSVLGLL